MRSSRWFNILGSFRPDLLVVEMRNDWNTHAKAFEYLCGVKLSKDQKINTSSLKNIQEDSRLSEVEEYDLSQALLTFQHELMHYFQSISSAFGVGYYILWANFNDFNQLFTKRILKFVNRNPKDLINSQLLEILSDIKDLPIDLNYGRHILQMYLDVFESFDNPELSAQNFVKQWNTLVKEIDEATRQDGDDINFIQIQTPENIDLKANPLGLSLTTLLESAVHCREMASILPGLSIRSEVFEKIFISAHHGPYKQLVDLLIDYVGDYVFLIIPKIVGVALQVPIISYHHFSEEVYKPSIQDWNPSWRAYKIIEGIKNGAFSIGDIMSAGGEDVICNHFGWPKVSKLMESFLSKDYYKGVNDTLGFLLSEYTSFCKIALVENPKLTWLDDLYSSHNPKVHQLGNVFQPPFVLFDTELVTQREKTVRLAIPLLLTFAYRDMLWGENLENTKKWVSVFYNRYSEISELAGEKFRELWQDSFFQTYGIKFSQVV